MARDLFAERGIVPRKKAPIPQGRDLFAERGIVPKKIAQRQMQEPEEGFFDSLGSALMSGVRGFNTAVERPIQGIMQPFTESQYAPDWLRNASKDVAARREANYEYALEQNPLSALAGNLGGNIALAAPTYMSGAGALNLSRLSPMASKILAGVLTGGAGGAAQYVNPGESRAENAGIGATIGGLLPPLASVAKLPFKAIKNVHNAYPAKKVAEKIIAGKLGAKEKYAKLYSDIFKEAEDAGIKHIRKPIKEVVKPTRRISLSSPRIKPTDPEKYGKAFAEFQKNPTPELAQKAQSDLGKLINKIEKSNTSSLSSETSRIKDLTKLRKGVIEDLTNSLEKKSPELAKRYKQIGEGYAKDVVPYNKSKAISEAQAGNLSKKDLTEALMKDKAFRHQMGHAHPELATRSIINPLLKSSRYWGPSIIGGYELGKLGKLHE